MSNNENISFWQRFLKSMTKANELGREEDVMLDHDYDGIKELDNVLPPWWIWGFYITIAISIFYYVAIHILGWYGQEDEYQAELKAHEAKVAKYKADHPELFKTENLIAYADAANIEKGKELFTTKTCTACHLTDGGGSIGPNMTDDYWILGGGFQNVFNTITKGGRPGKGMVAWESTITQKERRQLASYILTLRGTTPASPKAPEGDLWEGVKEPVGSAVESVEEVANDLKDGVEKIVKEVEEEVKKDAKKVEKIAKEVKEVKKKIHK